MDSEIAPTLSPFPPHMRDSALKALQAGDVLGFLICASNTDSVVITAQNGPYLKAHGLLEKAIVASVTATRVNNHHAYTALQYLFATADRERLRDAGDALPGGGPWTVYRGVAGIGRSRRVRGYSWTADLEKARWFAERAALFGLAAPAVVATTVDIDSVLFYANEREEREFVLQLDRRHPVTRLERLPEPATRAAIWDVDESA